MVKESVMMNSEIRKATIVVILVALVLAFAAVFSSSSDNKITGFAAYTKDDPLVITKETAAEELGDEKYAGKYYLDDGFWYENKRFWPDKQVSGTLQNTIKEYKDSLLEEEEQPSIIKKQDRLSGVKKKAVRFKSSDVSPALQQQLRRLGVTEAEFNRVKDTIVIETKSRSVAMARSIGSTRGRSVLVTEIDIVFHPDKFEETVTMEGDTKTTTSKVISRASVTGTNEVTYRDYPRTEEKEGVYTVTMAIGFDSADSKALNIINILEEEPKTKQEPVAYTGVDSEEDLEDITDKLNLKQNDFIKLKPRISKDGKYIEFGFKLKDKNLEEIAASVDYTPYVSLHFDGEPTSPGADRRINPQENEYIWEGITPDQLESVNEVKLEMSDEAAEFIWKQKEYKKLIEKIAGEKEKFYFDEDEQEWRKKTTKYGFIPTSREATKDEKADYKLLEEREEPGYEELPEEEELEEEELQLTQDMFEKNELKVSEDGEHIIFELEQTKGEKKGLSLGLYLDNTYTKQHYGFPANWKSPYSFELELSELKKVKKVKVKIMDTDTEFVWKRKEFESLLKPMLEKAKEEEKFYYDEDTGWRKKRTKLGIIPWTSTEATEDEMVEYDLLEKTPGPVYEEIEEEVTEEPPSEETESLTLTDDDVNIEFPSEVVKGESIVFKIEIDKIKESKDQKRFGWHLMLSGEEYVNYVGGSVDDYGESHDFDGLFELILTYEDWRTLENYELQLFYDKKEIYSTKGKFNIKELKPETTPDMPKVKSKDVKFVSEDTIQIVIDIDPDKEYAYVLEDDMNAGRLKRYDKSTGEGIIQKTVKSSLYSTYLSKGDKLTMMISVKPDTDSPYREILRERITYIYTKEEAEEEPEEETGDDMAEDWIWGDEELEEKKPLTGEEIAEEARRKAREENIIREETFTAVKIMEIADKVEENVRKFIKSRQTVESLKLETLSKLDLLKLKRAARKAYEEAESPQEKLNALKLKREARKAYQEKE